MKHVGRKKELLKNGRYISSVRNIVFTLLFLAYGGNETLTQSNGVAFLDSLIQSGIDVGQSASVILDPVSSGDDRQFAIFEDAQGNNPVNNTQVTITTASGQVFHLFADGSGDGNFYSVVGGETLEISGTSMGGDEYCTNKKPDHMYLNNANTGEAADGEICVGSSTPLALHFNGGGANQVASGSDKFHLKFEADNLVNTGSIDVRVSNTPFRHGIDNPKDFGYTVYTIPGPVGGSANSLNFNQVVPFDMHALNQADKTGGPADGINDGLVYVTFVEHETGGSYHAYANQEISALHFTYDFSPPEIFPNPVSQSNGIRYTVPSAFADGCSIELVNMSGQVKETRQHDSGGSGSLSFTNRVSGGVYMLRFINNGFVETVKVIIKG